MANEQLQNYVKQGKSSGKTDEQIRQELLGTGWQDKDIDEALQVKPPASKSFKFPVLILTILGIAVAGYFASAYYFTLWPFETSAPIPTFTPRPSSSPTPIPSSKIEGWKTYTNIQYGFEVKYPPLGAEQRIAEDKKINEYFIAMFDLNYRGDGKDYFETAYSFGVLPNPNKFSLEQYYKADECLSLLLGEEIKLYSRDNISWSRYFEEGTLPLPEEYFNKDCGPIYSVADFLKPSKEFLIRIYFNGQTHELDLYGYNTNEKIDALTDQIIANFKFIK